MNVQKYNMFMAQIGCAAIGVLALTILGPCWLARSTALSAAMAFMIYTRSVHPPGKLVCKLSLIFLKKKDLMVMYIRSCCAKFVFCVVAASLPLLFIDGAKLHQLNYWYALFPGAAGCILLCLIVSFVSSLPAPF